MAEDDGRVIEALKLRKLVVGHSMAGSEMTFLAQKHSSKLAGGSPKENSRCRLFCCSLQASQRRTGEPSFPAAEIRNMYVINSDGSIRNNRTPPCVGKQIEGGSTPKDYRSIDIPVSPLSPSRWHHMFLNEQDVVLQHIQSFLDRLPK